MRKTKKAELEGHLEALIQTYTLPYLLNTLAGLTFKRAVFTQNMAMDAVTCLLEDASEKCCQVAKGLM